MKKNSNVLLVFMAVLFMSTLSSSTALFSNSREVEASGNADTILLSQKQGLTSKSVKSGGVETTSIILENESPKGLHVETELAISKPLPKGVRLTVNGKVAFANKTKEIYSYEELKHKGSSEHLSYEIKVHYDETKAGERAESGSFTLSAKSIGKLKGTKWSTKTIQSSATIKYEGVNKPLNVPVIYNPIGGVAQGKFAASVTNPDGVRSTANVLNSKGGLELDKISHAKGPYLKGTLGAYYNDDLHTITYDGDNWQGDFLGMIIPNVKGGNAKLLGGVWEEIEIEENMGDILSRSDGTIHLVRMPMSKVKFTSVKPINEMITLLDDEGNYLDELYMNGTSAISDFVPTHTFNVDMPMSKINNFEYSYSKTVGKLRIRSTKDYEIKGSISEGFTIKEIAPIFEFSKYDSKYAVSGFVDNIDEALEANGLPPEFKYNPIIPSEYRGEPVTGIGVRAFYKAELTSVTLPDTIAEINRGAFEGNNIKSLTIPNSVSMIGASAFEGNNIKSLTIPKNVNTIGDRAFNRSGLAKLDIEPGLTKIGSAAFYGNELTELTLPPTLTKMSYQAFSNNSLTSVQIPSSLTELEDQVFQFNKITHVTIPETITKIGDYAFSGNELESLVIPKRTMDIRQRAFSRNKLKSVSIPEGIKVISSGLFEVNQLAEVKIPSSVTEIGSSAFFSNNLTSVIIPQGVTIIESSIFRQNKLESVVIPEGVTSIGMWAFLRNNLTSVKLPESLTEIEAEAFSGNSMSTVVIPSGVKTVGEKAFINNGFTTLVIPDSLTSIGESAFMGGYIGTIYANELKGDTWPMLRGYEFTPRWVRKNLSEYKE